MKIRVKIKDTGVIKELTLKDYQLDTIKKFRKCKRENKKII